MSILMQLAIAAAIAVAGFASGIKWHAGQDAIAAQARDINQRAAERLRRQNSNTAAIAHEADKVVIQREFVPITEEVERVVTQIVYRDAVCLPDDGLRIIRGAIARANGDPGEPRDAVPAGPAAP